MYPRDTIHSNRTPVPCSWAVTIATITVRVSAGMSVHDRTFPLELFFSSLQCRCSVKCPNMGTSSGTYAFWRIFMAAMLYVRTGPNFSLCSLTNDSNKDCKSLWYKLEHAPHYSLIHASLVIIKSFYKACVKSSSYIFFLISVPQNASVQRWV